MYLIFILNGNANCKPHIEVIKAHTKIDEGIPVRNVGKCLCWIYWYGYPSKSDYTWKTDIIRGWFSKNLLITRPYSLAFFIKSSGHCTLEASKVGTDAAEIKGYCIRRTSIPLFLYSRGCQSCRMQRLLLYTSQRFFHSTSIHRAQ